MIIQTLSFTLGAIGFQEKLIISVIVVPVLLLIVAISAFRKGYRRGKN